MITAFIETMRPKQWTKNAFVFFALVFDKQFFIQSSFFRTFAGFILFCFISSSVYIFNDLADIESDKQHPKKRARALPSGRLSPRFAFIGGVFLAIGSLTVAFALSTSFFLILLSYFLLNLAYSKWLKNIPIIDVLVLAAGFILRVEAGVLLITVERFSPWLYVVTSLGALYLGFGKRRSELNLVTTDAGAYRKVLDGYTIPLLDQYITIVSSATILSYSLYTFFAPNLPENHSMMITIPLMAYIIFRYLYLIHMTNDAGAPDEVLLTDRPIQIAILILAAFIFFIFYLT